MPKCAIGGCQRPVDSESTRRPEELDGYNLCATHAKWTAPLMRRCLTAIETAIANEDGLDGLEGEQILRDIGHWPKSSPRKQPSSVNHCIHHVRLDTCAACRPGPREQP
jgi:hypothetical protein